MYWVSNWVINNSWILGALHCIQISSCATCATLWFLNKKSKYYFISDSGYSETPAAPWGDDVGPAGGWEGGMWQGPGTLATACSSTDQQLPSSLSIGKCIFNQIFKEIKSLKKTQSTYLLDSIRQSKCLNHHNQRLYKFFFDWHKFGAPNIQYFVIIFSSSFFFFSFLYSFCETN